MTIKYCYIKTSICLGNANNILVKINHRLLNNNGIVGSDVTILIGLWLTQTRLVVTSVG